VEQPPVELKVFHVKQLVEMWMDFVGNF
jgi:hypothetical protein